jgi:prolyl oligopeptidase
MYRRVVAALVLFSSSSACVHQTPPPPPAVVTPPPGMSYPAPPRSDVVDDYFGTKVPDPFRTLENPDSPETKAWVDAENALTESWLGAVPSRSAIHARMESLWNYERFGLPVKKGQHYFSTHNDGLQNQAVIFVADGVDAPTRVLLDPNTFSTDGTVALCGWSPSEDGKKLAFGLSDGGSDWCTWHVRDVASGIDAGDTISWTKFTGASWSHDNKGFYYSRFPATSRLDEPNYYNKLYYHKLGEAQERDTLIFEQPDRKEQEFSGFVTEDGHYLIIQVSEGTEQKSRVYYKDLSKPKSGVEKLLDDFDALYGFVGNIQSRFLFYTNLDAPRYKVVAIDLKKPERTSWKIVIPEGSDTLEGVSAVGGHLVATMLHDAHTTIHVYKPDGTPVRDVLLPGLGTAGGFGGRMDDPETFFSFGNFTTPDEIFRYDVARNVTSSYRRPKVSFNPSDFETTQVFYTNPKDGTRIPMFLVRKRSTQPGPDTPTLLYGYGGFNISMTPGFSVPLMVWLEMGGLYALPNIRGGGEYGEAWHLAGTREHKQNVFDDFIGAAEWLVAQGYTRPNKLAIRGGSNGGLLVGACMTQRPELFGAALPAVGVMDMLRYHKFTIGWGWSSDYGTSDDPAMFPFLIKYSPLQSVRPHTAYPATLITTAYRDDRVVPAHSLKFAAALQAAQDGPKPILIRVETRAGHGGGKPTSMMIDERSDEWAFLVRALDMSVNLGGNAN